MNTSSASASMMNTSTNNNQHQQQPHRPKGLNRSRLTIRLIGLAMIMVARFMVSIHEMRFINCGGVRPWWAPENYFGSFARHAKKKSSRKTIEGGGTMTEQNNEDENGEGNEKKGNDGTNASGGDQESEQKKIDDKLLLKKFQEAQQQKLAARFRDDSSMTPEKANALAAFDELPSTHVKSLFQTQDESSLQHQALLLQQQQQQNNNQDSTSGNNSNDNNNNAIIKQRLITRLSSAKRQKKPIGDIVHTVATNPDDILEVMTTSIAEAAKTLEEIPFQEDFSDFPKELTIRVFDGIRKAHSFIADLLRYRSYRRKRLREEMYGFPESEGGNAAAQVLKNAMILHQQQQQHGAGVDLLSLSSSTLLKVPPRVLPSREECMSRILEACKNSIVFKDWPQSIFHHVVERCSMWQQDSSSSSIAARCGDVDNKAAPIRRYQPGETIIFHGEDDQKVVWFLLKGAVWELDKVKKNDKRCGLSVNGKAVNLHGVSSPSLLMDVFTALNANSNENRNQNRHRHRQHQQHHYPPTPTSTKTVRVVEENDDDGQDNIGTESGATTSRQESLISLSHQHEEGNRQKSPAKEFRKRRKSSAVSLFNKSTTSEALSATSTSANNVSSTDPHHHHHHHHQNRQRHHHHHHFMVSRQHQITVNGSNVPFSSNTASPEELSEVSRRFFSSGTAMTVASGSSPSGNNKSSSNAIFTSSKPCVLRDGACILQVENKHAFVAATPCIVAQLPLQDLENCFCGRGTLKTGVLTSYASVAQKQKPTSENDHQQQQQQEEDLDATTGTIDASKISRGTGFEHENDLYTYTPSNPTDWGQLARARARLLSLRSNNLIPPMTVDFLRASRLLAKLPDVDADSIIGHVKRCTFLKNACVVPRVIEEDDDDDEENGEDDNDEAARNKSSHHRKRRVAKKIDPVAKWKMHLEAVLKGDVQTKPQEKAESCFCSDPSVIRLLQESIIWIVKGSAAAASQRRTRASNGQWFRVKFFEFRYGTTLGEAACYFQHESVFDVTATSMIDVYFLPRQALLQRTMFDFGFRNAISEGSLFLRQTTGVNALTIRTLRAVRWIRASIELGLITDFHLFDAVKLFEYRTFSPGELLASTSDQVDSIFVVAAGLAVHSNASGSLAQRSVKLWSLIGSESAVYPALRWQKPIVAMTVCEVWAVSPEKLQKAFLSIPQAMRIVADDGVTIIAARPHRPPSHYGGEENVLYQQQLAATAWDESPASQKKKLLALRKVSNYLFEHQDEVVKCVPRVRPKTDNNEASKNELTTASLLHQENNDEDESKNNDDTDKKIESNDNDNTKTPSQSRKAPRHIFDDELPITPLREMVEKYKQHELEYHHQSPSPSSSPSSSPFKSLKNLPPRKLNEKSEDHHLNPSSPLSLIRAYQDQYHKQEMVDRVNRNWQDIVDWSSPERKRREGLERAKKLDFLLHSPPKTTVKDQLVHGLRTREEFSGNNLSVSRSLTAALLASNSNSNASVKNHHNNNIDNQRQQNNLTGEITCPDQQVVNPDNLHTTNSARSSLRAVAVGDDFAGHLVHTAEDDGDNDPTQNSKTAAEHEAADAAMRDVIQKLKDEGLHDDEADNERNQHQHQQNKNKGNRHHHVIEQRLLSVQLSPQERMNRQLHEKLKQIQLKAPHLVAKYAMEEEREREEEKRLRENGIIVSRQEHGHHHHRHHSRTKEDKKREKNKRSSSNVPIASYSSTPVPNPTALPPFIQQLISASSIAEEKSRTPQPTNKKQQNVNRRFTRLRDDDDNDDDKNQVSPLRSQCGSLVMRARSLLNGGNVSSKK